MLRKRKLQYYKYKSRKIATNHRKRYKKLSLLGAILGKRAYDKDIEKKTSLEE